MIAEWEALSKQASSMADGRTVKDMAEQKLAELRQQHKQEVTAAMQGRPIISRLHAGQAKVDKLQKQAAEQETKVTQLAEQLEQARQEAAKLRAELTEAQSDLKQLAAEMAKDGSAPMEEEESSGKEEVGELVVTLGEWLAAASVEDKDQRTMLGMVLKHWPSGVVIKEEPQLTSATQETRDAEERSRSRSPARKRAARDAAATKQQELFRKLTAQHATLS